MKLIFKQSTIDRAMYHVGYRVDYPRYYWRENQRIFEVYHPAINGSLKVLSRELAERVLTILIEHYAPAKKILMPIRGDAQKPYVRKPHNGGRPWVSRKRKAQA